MEDVIRFLNDTRTCLIGFLVRGLEKFFKVFKLYRTLAVLTVLGSLDSNVGPYLFTDRRRGGTKEHSVKSPNPFNW